MSSSAVEACAGQRLPEILGFKSKFNPFLSSDRRGAATGTPAR